MDLRDRLQASLGSAYIIETELGGGGMSRVFVAVDPTLGRRVVVKVLPPDMAAAVSVERFKREIVLAARLQHPHVVPLLSAGELDGVPYFTMPFVEGESLRVRLAQRGELPVTEAMRVLREVASALAYAHDRGIVHRDVKPDNILLSGGAAMVTDFGVAKALSMSGDRSASSLTSMGVALGTPAYMAPEQASADPNTDHRADIYALGCVAYELLAGVPPFAGRSPQAMLAAHVQEEPESLAKRRPNIPPALAALVMRCLAKRPADRPQTAAEVVHALDDITTPSGGMQPTSARPAIAPAGGSRRGVLIGAAALVVVLVAAYAVTRPRGVAAPEAPGAPAAAAVRSLVVLPFVNVGGDTANEYFADGMTDELTGALARVAGLRVASRTSAYAYKGQKGVDVRTVGKMLNVESVVEGTVRRAGGKVRITAELSGANDGLTRWSETYERSATDVFAVQDELARAIAAALQVSLDSPAAVHRGETHDPQAHDLFLRAEYLSNKFDERALRASIVLYEQAIQRDSTYGQAWAGLANAWGRLADDFLAPAVATPRNRAALVRLGAIDSMNPEFHAQRALLALWGEWDIPLAAREFARAFALDPKHIGYPDFVFGYSTLLRLQGHADSARAVVAHVIDINPADENALNAAKDLVVYGDTALAAGYCQRLLELEPGDRCAGTRLVHERKFDSLAALARARVAANAPGTREAAYAGLELARWLAMAGKVPEARQVLVTTLARRGDGYVREDQIARTWLVVGDRDSTFAWLNRGIPAHASAMLTLPIVTYWAPIRSDRRYTSLLERMGIAPYVK